MKNETIESQIAEFLSNERILVVEPAASFRQVIIGCLQELGAPEENILMARKYKEAFNFMFSHRPRIVITEFMVGDRFGLSLVDIQTQFFDDMAKIAVLVTHNSSDTAVAEAAEEHVDAYILKPFSTGDFRDRLISLFSKRINPSDYAKKIQEGKKHLALKDFEKAAQDFAEAGRMSRAPALAFYYSGYTQFLQQKYENAVREFKKGLAVQPLHFKCLMGEFDALFEQRKYHEAYQLVPVIRNNFPISPQRLGNIFIAAVFSQHMDEISTYYNLYQRLDNRPPELVKIFSAALLTAGKHFIKNNNLGRAQECFEMGVAVTGPETSYLEKIVREFIRVGDGKRAEAFLAKFRGEDVGSPIYLRMSFLTSPLVISREEAIERGRKLVGQGFADADCFRLLVRLLMEAKNKLLAENIVTLAQKNFPELRDELYQMIDPGH